MSDTSTLPFSPLALDELAFRRGDALCEAGLAMVCAHKYPHDRDFHFDRAAEHVANYDALCEASVARRAVR